MQDEMLTKIFEKLVGMESGMKSMESEMQSMKSDMQSMKSEIKEDIRHLKETTQALHDLVVKTYRKIEDVEQEHLAWIHKLTIDCSKNTVDIKMLKEKEDVKKEQQMHIKEVEKEQQLQSVWIRRLAADCSYNSAQIDLLKEENVE